MTTFTNEERQFLRTILSERLQDGARLDSERQLCNDIFNLLRDGNADLTPGHVQYTQCMLQELSEIWGRNSSTANEKQPVALHSFVPQRTRLLIQSAAAKLGAKILLDTESRCDVLSPRSEGSSWIMTDVTKNHIA